MPWGSATRWSAGHSSSGRRPRQVEQRRVDEGGGDAHATQCARCSAARRRRSVARYTDARSPYWPVCAFHTNREQHATHGGVGACADRGAGRCGRCGGLALPAATRAGRSAPGTRRRASRVPVRCRRRPAAGAAAGRRPVPPRRPAARRRPRRSDRRRAARRQIVGAAEAPPRRAGRRSASCCRSTSCSATSTRAHGDLPLPGRVVREGALRRMMLLPGDYLTVSRPAGTEVVPVRRRRPARAPSSAGAWAMSVTGDTAVRRAAPGAPTRSA